MSKPDRTKERQAKNDERDMGVPTMNDVVVVPRKERQEPLKNLGALAGIGFRGFNTVPDSEPVEEPVGDEVGDPALNALIEQMQLPGGEDHNVAPEIPAEEKGEMDSLSDRRSKEREQRRLKRAEQRTTHTENRKSAPEEAGEVRQLRKELAQAIADKMPDLVKQINEDIGFLMENPEVKTLIEGEDQRVRDNAAKARRDNLNAVLAEEEAGADEVVARLNESAESTVHAAIKKTLETGKPHFAPAVKVLRGVKIPSTGPDREGNFDIQPLTRIAVAQYQLHSGKNRDGKQVLHSQLQRDGLNLPECLWKHQGWKDAGAGVHPFPCNMERGYMYEPRGTVQTSAGLRLRPSYHIDMAYFDLFKKEEEAIRLAEEQARRAEGRKKAAENFAAAKANANTDPMAFVLEGAVGPVFFSPTPDMEENLQAVAVRYSPKELAEIRLHVAKTLRDWANEVSAHPTAKKQEEQALRDLTDGNRASLNSRALLWEKADDSYDVALVAYGFDPEGKPYVNLSGLRSRKATVVRIQREGKSPWQLELHYPVLMKMVVSNLHISPENPEGKGSVEYQVAKKLIPTDDHNEVDNLARSLGRLTRGVILAKMREAAADKPHRHSWRRDGTCACKAQREPVASA